PEGDTSDGSAPAYRPGSDAGPRSQSIQPGCGRRDRAWGIPDRVHIRHAVVGAVTSLIAAAVEPLILPHAEIIRLDGQAEWLAERRRGVGSSEAASVLGVS